MTDRVTESQQRRPIEFTTEQQLGAFIRYTHILVCVPVTNLTLL
jgi:hypothetical protein